MSVITVSLSKAVLCIASECFPALVGNATPTGSYAITRVLVEAPGYGGDVLQFAEDGNTIFAIHRVWLMKPSQNRLERLQSDDPAQRRHVTNGCINVAPDVYDKLDDADEIIIVP